MKISKIPNNNPLLIVDELKNILVDQLQSEIEMEKVRTIYTLKHENLKLVVKTLKAEREVFCAFMKNDHKRRSNIYSKLLSTVDKALELNDIELLKWSLNQIVNVISDDPFVEYNDFRRKLYDNNQCIEI